MRYPVLSSLAQDYLGCSASSAFVEKTFSAAADVCSTNRGRLNPRTIETCVSSMLWLRDGIPLLGSFKDVGKFLDNFSSLKITNKNNRIDF